MDSQYKKAIQLILSLEFVPQAWRLPVFALAGVAAGLALFLVPVSEAASYLSDDPRACINCHIMVPQYANWERSAHKSVAACNDCHVPHDHLWRKYEFKAQDGARHASMFTLGLQPQVIRALKPSQDCVHENCLRCHDRQVSKLTGLTQSGRPCLDCHRATPHGDVGGTASTPNVVHPRLPPLFNYVPPAHPTRPSTRHRLAQGTLPHRGGQQLNAFSQM